MTSPWEIDFLRHLADTCHGHGDPRLRAVKCHPQRGCVSLKAKSTKSLECRFATNQFSEDPSSHVLAVSCVPAKWTAVDEAGLRDELARADIRAELGIREGAALFQTVVGYGPEFRFAVHDRTVLDLTTQWAINVFRVLLDHLERHGQVLSPAAMATQDEPAPDFAMALEAHLEDLLVRHWNVLEWPGKLDLLGRQIPCGELGTLDLLAQDRDAGQLVAIELKRDRSDDRVVGQLSRYMGYVQKHHPEAGDQPVRGIVLVREPTDGLRAAVAASPLMELCTYTIRPVIATGPGY